MSEIIRAPFSAEQVVLLNRYQESGVFHPFTCGKRDEHPDAPDILVATEAGWVCPAPGCDYTQSWARETMTNEAVIASGEQLLRGLKTARCALDRLREIAEE